MGCEFKLQPLHVAGWTFASAASAVVATPTLPPPVTDAVRLQLRLRQLPAETQSELIGALCVHDLAATLGVPEERVRLDCMIT